MRRAASVALCAWLLASCAAYTGTGVASAPPEDTAEKGWTMIKDVPVHTQQADWDCGLAALASVLGYHGVTLDPQLTAKTLGPIAAEKRPIRAGDLRRLAKAHDLHAFLIEGRPEDLSEHLARGRPVIVGMVKPTVSGTKAHYEVVVGMNRERGRVMTLDPSLGFRQDGLDAFLGEWRNSGSVLLVVFE